jgi:hypothetical protein
MTWKEELYAAARSIASKAHKPLWLCASGGIDSEIMCHAFFDQGINFSVMTLAHTDGSNEHDIAHARAWCQKHRVHQEIIRIDMHDFLGSQVPYYTEQGYVSSHLLPYMQIKLMETAGKMGGYAVIAAGKQLYKIDTREEYPSRRDVFLEFTSGHGVPLEWLKRNDATHEPYFLYGSPELCLSYLRIPLIDFALDHPDVFRHPTNTFILKRLVSQQYWPTLENRPKFHGMEKIPAELSVMRKAMKKAAEKQVQTCTLSIPEFTDQLTGRE